MEYPDKFNIALNPGDMLVDNVNNEVGILIEKYKVLPENTYDNGFVTQPIWGWKITWAGADMHATNRFGSITESGLKHQIVEGRVKLIKNANT